MGSWRVSEARSSHGLQAQKRVKELGMLFMPDSLYGTLWYATYVGLIATGSRPPLKFSPPGGRYLQRSKLVYQVRQLAFAFFMSCGESRRRATRTAGHQTFGTWETLRLISLSLLQARALPQRGFEGLQSCFGHKKRPAPGHCARGRSHNEGEIPMCQLIRLAGEAGVDDIACPAHRSVRIGHGNWGYGESG